MDFEDVYDGPFYRVEQNGAQVRLWINRQHRFFTDVYGYSPTTQEEATRLMRAGFDLLLFTMGEAELNAEAQPDRKEWYRRERVDWSRDYSTALERYDQFRNVADTLTQQVEVKEAEDSLAEASDKGAEAPE